MLFTTALSACATRNLDSSRHPVQNGHLFQPPIVNLIEYASVEARSHNDNRLALAVAISGGGQRAGNLGVGALLGLEKVAYLDGENNVLQEVDYFSTVSGGGMAAAAYFSSFYSHAKLAAESAAPYSFAQAMQTRDEKLSSVCQSKRLLDFYRQTLESRPKQTTDPCLRRHLERGYHGNIASALLNPKVIFTNFDRGDVLEQAFATELLAGNWLEFNGQRQMTLREVFPKASTVTSIRLPMWIANATVLENGAVFPFTPDILEIYEINEYVHRMQYVRRDTGLENENFYYDVPLSLGLTASGNFPSLIAPQTLGASYDAPRNPYLHLIDGGVSDNLGIHTAISLLENRVNDDLKKVLIVIDAYPGEFSPYSRSKGGPNFLNVYRKLPNMPLNGARGRARQTLASFDLRPDSHVIYLSFDDLYRPMDGDLHEEDPSKVAQLFDELQNYYSVVGTAQASISKVRADNPDLESPFELARKVKTSYNITEEEQDFLIAVGKYIVDSNEERIADALKSSRSQ